MLVDLDSKFRKIKEMIDGRVPFKVHTQLLSKEINEHSEVPIQIVHLASDWALENTSCIDIFKFSMLTSSFIYIFATKKFDLKYEKTEITKYVHLVYSGIEKRYYAFGHVEKHHLNFYSSVSLMYHFYKHFFYYQYFQRRSRNLSRKMLIGKWNWSRPVLKTYK